MNRELFENQWTQIRIYVRDRWGNLTEEDIRQINGRYDQLINKLQQRYGYTRDEAEDEVRNWTPERAGKAYAYGTQQGREREDEAWKTKKSDANSLLKWLLVAGIPLLLLAGYIAHQNSRAAEEAAYTRGRPAQDRAFIQETPEDRSISNNVRRSLLENGTLTTNVRNLRIETANGVVTLTGVVESNPERDLILRIAE